VLNLFAKVERKPHEKAAEIVELVSNQLFRSSMYFQWYLLQRLPVFFVYGSKKIAWTDGYGIYVTKGFLQMKNTMQLNVIRHELYHVALNHVSQLAKRLRRATSTFERNVIEIVHNIISDAVVNGIILKENKRMKIDAPLEKSVTPDYVSNVIEGDVVKLGFVNAVEKLLYLIRKNVVEVNVFTPDGARVDLSKEPIGKIITEHGYVVVEFVNRRNGSKITVDLVLDQEGSGVGAGGTQAGEEGSSRDDTGKGSSGQKEEPVMIKKPVGRRPRTPEDIERVIREARDFDIYKRTVSGSKLAGGFGAGDLEYELSSIGAKRPEWEAKLTRLLNSFFARNVLVSWHFLNRKAPFVKPGLKYLSMPDTHILLDVSGSMLDGTLEKALKRIVYIVEKYPDIKVKLYQWSTIAKLPEDIDRKFAENIRKYKKIPITSGGTTIGPVLNMVLQYVKPTDAVVVLTDGYIFDIDSNEVIEKFRKLSRKAGIVVFGSLGYIPETLPQTVYKIRLED
jgi:predicted metal-dependent peptidase